jgi:hypothetical protein
MTHDIDTVTDRLAFRKHGFPYPRNSMIWPWLRFYIAQRRVWHAIRPDVWKLAGLMGRAESRLRSLWGSR